MATFARLAVAVADLREVTKDLRGYIERRASELAAPLIAAANAAADERVAEAHGEIERRDDVIKELSRRIAATDRNLARWQFVTGCRSADEFASENPR